VDDIKTLSLSLEKLGESDFDDLEVKVEKICCEFCEEQFFIPANLDLHVQGKHQSATDNQLSKCMFCSKLFKCNDTYKNHFKTFHKGEKIRCKFKRCSIPFKSEKGLKDHLKLTHLVDETNLLECKLCKYWYSSKNSLHAHMKWHAKKPTETKPKILKCLFCPESFSRRKYFNCHIRQNHELEAVKCRHFHCEVYFKAKEQMEQHFATAHNNNCKFCEFTCFSRQLLSSHLKKMHLEKKCKYGVCTFYTDSKEELEKHLNDKHNKQKQNTVCVYCGKNFENRYHASSHVKEVHSKIAIRCDKKMCCLYFKTQEEAEKHKKEGHQRVERHKQTVECLFCQKTMWDKAGYSHHIKACHSKEAIRCKYKRCFTFFKSENDLQKHYEEKHAGKYKCALCDYNASFKQTLNLHLQAKHLSKVPKKCPHCPKVLGTKLRLLRHIYHEHKPKQKCPHCKELWTNLYSHVITVECPICSQPFPCKKLLTEHRKECKIKFECRECGKKFKGRSNLKYHVYFRHKTGLKGQKWRGFKCKFCGKFFQDIQSAKNHKQKEHRDELKFNCNFCQQRFFWRYEISQHMILKHGLGGFQCELCGKRNYNKHELSKHLLEKHGDYKPQLVDCADCGKILKKDSYAKHYIAQHIHKS